MPETPTTSPLYDQLLGEQHPNRRSVILKAEHDMATDAGHINLGALASAAEGWLGERDASASVSFLDGHVAALRRASADASRQTEILARSI